jgi:hypothetical protein
LDLQLNPSRSLGMRHHHQINDLKFMPCLSCLGQISNTNLSP